MTNSWPVMPLGEVIRHRKEFVRISDLETYKRCRVQLHAQGIVLRDIVAGAEIKTKDQQICRAGELLVAEIDAKVGGFGVVPDELDGSIVSSHYFLFGIDERKLDRRFLNYFVRTPFFRDQVAARGSTNYAAIRPHHVLQYQLPLPPISEQRRIVARIEELAAKINEARSLRKQAAKEADALVAASMKLCFEFSGASTRLSDYVQVQGGYAFPSAGYDETGTHKIVRIGNVRDGFLDLTRAPVRWTPIGDIRVLKYELNPGDLVISMTGTREKRDYGFVAEVPSGEKLLLNQRVGRVIIRRQIDRKYLFYFLRSPFFRDNLFPRATGTANQANVGNADIESVAFAPPQDLSEQRRMVTELDTLEAQVDALKKVQDETATELDAMLPSVFQKAFSGRL